MNQISAVIFDLDGVITDTAEFHYQAWQRLADEEGLTFDRTINEQLRGIGRRKSLEILLAGRELDEDQAQVWANRKNGYYGVLLEGLTSNDALPGVVELLTELRSAGIKTAIASASRNTPKVIAQLGIGELFDAVADGRTVAAAKPAPDVFLRAAELLDVPPGLCVVIEDAAAGVDGALAAGMWAVGLGPAERVGHGHVRFADLAGIGLAELRAGLADAAWTVHEHHFDPAELHHKETVFTVGNGNLAVRGSFEERYPGESAASFLHRVWDDMPLNFTELAALPRWWGIDVWVDGHRFGMDQGEVIGYERRVDLRTGVLSRTVQWRPTPAAPPVALHFERLVSLGAPHQAGVRLRVEPDSGSAEVRVRTGFDTYVENTGLVHWEPVAQSSTSEQVTLQVRTRQTGVEVALAARVTTFGASASTTAADADRSPAIDNCYRVAAGAPVTISKFVAVVPDLDSREPVGSAASQVAGMAAVGWDGWRQANDTAWAQAWAATDIAIDGDPEAQIAVRFNIFQMMIAAPRFTDRASIGAKTLSGYGYRHHAFWDTETFMLPMFSYTQPEIARNMLMYRWHNLPGARAKAAANGFRGAQFPWESAADGSEVTPKFAILPQGQGLVRIWTGDIEIHITSDIAFAVMQYWRVTGDDEFMARFGAEIVLDGARFWASAARAEEDARSTRYHFRDVIGPDEYHDHVDDNAYTNYLAQWHLRTAGQVLQWLQAEHPERAAELASALEIDATEQAKWAQVADLIYLPDPVGGVTEQFAGYFQRIDADLAAMRDPDRTESMQGILGLEQTGLTQILKQPDVLMMHYLLPDRFTREQLIADYEYYDPRTDHEHGSSLGPSISAVLACWAGQPDYGYEHFRRAARADLRDVRDNTSDGIHGASAGGLWQAVVMGFGGLRVDPAGWRVEPMLPKHWTRLTFNFRHRGKAAKVELTQ
ncbi:MAG: beta-phosphoglucomutase [Candidatus Nanopelagicales bacterium]